MATCKIRKHSLTTSWPSTMLIGTRRLNNSWLMTSVPIRFFDAFTNAKQNQGGPDGWMTAELSLMSLRAAGLLAEMLNAIEKGAPWPQDITKGRAAFLAKDPAILGDPLAYSVLLILSVIYRKWASIRLMDMKPWIDKWTDDDLFMLNAGVEDA